MFLLTQTSDLVLDPFQPSRPYLISPSDPAGSLALDANTLAMVLRKHLQPLKAAPIVQRSRYPLPASQHIAFGNAAGQALLATVEQGKVNGLFFLDSDGDHQLKGSDLYVEQLHIGEALHELGLRYGLGLYLGAERLIPLEAEESVFSFLMRMSFPNNELELRITSDPAWREGANWGFPRRGHPEGKVIFHVDEVLGNVGKLAPVISPENLLRLRLVAIIHDTFKHKVDRSQPIAGENDHAMIARRFAERFLHDPELLDLIQHHDAVYRIWRRTKRKRDWNEGAKKLRALFDQIHCPVQLYYWFYLCDNNTGDKGQDPVRWFEEVFKDELERVEL